MPIQFWVHHVTLSVRDIQEAIRFYEVFGFWVVVHYKEPDGSVEIVHLKLQEMLLEIFWYREQRAAPASAADLSTDLPRIGVKHFALEVASVEAAKDFVLAQGFATDIQIQDGRTGVRYFFIKDPSGNWVEVVEDERKF